MEALFVKPAMKRHSIWRNSSRGVAGRGGCHFGCCVRGMGGVLAIRDPHAFHGNSSTR